MRFCQNHWPLLQREQEAGVLIRKLSQLLPLRWAKWANPRYFILPCGISCELAGCVHRLRPIQTLVSYTLADLNIWWHMPLFLISYINRLILTRAHLTYSNFAWGLHGGVEVMHCPNCGR